MLIHRCRGLGRPSRWLLIGLLSTVCFGLGCRDLAAKRTGKKDAVLAQVDDVAITVAEFEERLNSQSPYVRARYASLDHKKEFLENLVKFEVLAAEARRLGLDRDPEVVRAMKQVMIQKLLKQQIDRFKAEDIPEAEIQTYFDGHQDEYNRPPEIRVSMILVPDEASANKVLADPRSKGLENLGFRELVTQYSIDQETKERGGDLRFFDAQNRELPAELIAAAFKLVNIGDVSPAVKTQRGYMVLKLTGQRRALVRTLAEVSQQIRAKLFRERRQKLMDEYEEQVRKKSRIAVHDAELAQVRVDLSGSVGAPDDLRPAKGTGAYHPVGQTAPQASPARPSTPALAPVPSAPSAVPSATAPAVTPSLAKP